MLYSDVMSISYVEKMCYQLRKSRDHSTIILFSDLCTLSERQLGRNAGNVKLFILPLCKLVRLCATDSNVCNYFLNGRRGDRRLLQDRYLKNNIPSDTS